MQRTFAAFVLLGALLLFALEPMAGRIVLPSFGSAFHVWSTTLLFFQCALVLAYAYAHLLAPRIGAWHLVGLVAVGCALPFTLTSPSAIEVESGALAVVFTLSRIALLPFLALATTTVVAHSWWTRAGLSETRAPIGLYAISNIGSFIALLGYALLIEPWFGLRMQTRAFIALYVVYVAIAARTFILSRRAWKPETPSALSVLSFGKEDARWLVLALTTSSLLYAVSNVITVDIGNLPLLWVLPLSAYLLSLVLAFSERKVPMWLRRFWPVVAVVGLTVFALSGRIPAALTVAVHTSVLFVLAWVVHETLVACRPDVPALTRFFPERETSKFYLVTAVGGALGGALVSLLAPQLFTRLWEYPLALLLAFVVTRLRKQGDAEKADGPWLSVLGAALLLAVGYRLVMGQARQGEHVIASVRSPYGLYRVVERETALGTQRDLISGDTTHGRQFVSGAHAQEPLSYYHREGCLGDAMALLALREGPRSLGVVGLGAGVMSAYLEPGEVLDVYEIDPLDVALARTHFTFLDDTRGEVRMHVGDARTVLEGEGAGARIFDLLLVDAFSGDAIPTHLITREAIALYLTRIAPNGLLLMHISSQLYTLEPVLARIAETLDVELRWKRRAPDEVTRVEGVALEDPALFVAIFYRGHGWETSLEARGWRVSDGATNALLFEDDFAPILRTLRMREARR